MAKKKDNTLLWLGGAAVLAALATSKRDNKVDGIFGVNTIDMGKFRERRFTSKKSYEQAVRRAQNWSVKGWQMDRQNGIEYFGCFYYYDDKGLVYLIDPDKKQ